MHLAWSHFLVHRFGLKDGKVTSLWLHVMQNLPSCSWNYLLSESMATCCFQCAQPWVRTIQGLCRNQAEWNLGKVEEMGPTKMYSIGVSIAQKGKKERQSFTSHVANIYQIKKTYWLNWLPLFFQSFQVTVAMLPLHSMTGPCQQPFRNFGPLGWREDGHRCWPQILEPNLGAGAAFLCHFSMGSTLRLS